MIIDLVKATQVSQLLASSTGSYYSLTVGALAKLAHGSVAFPPARMYRSVVQGYRRKCTANSVDCMSARVPVILRRLCKSSRWVTICVTWCRIIS